MDSSEVWVKMLPAEEGDSILITIPMADKRILIYCSSTANAIENARNYSVGMQDKDNKDLIVLSKDTQIEVHGDYYLAELIKKGVAYHIGYLPSTIRMRIEEAFHQLIVFLMIGMNMLNMELLTH